MLLTPLPNSSDWSKGMVLFVDNEKHHYTSTTHVIYEWHWQFPLIQVSWKGFQSSQYLLFSIEASQNGVNGFFLIKDNLQQMAKLVVNRMGRLKVESG